MVVSRRPEITKTAPVVVEKVPKVEDQVKLRLTDFLKSIEKKERKRRLLSEILKFFEWLAKIKDRPCTEVLLPTVKRRQEVKRYVHLLQPFRKEEYT